MSGLLFTYRNQRQRVSHQQGASYGAPLSGRREGRGHKGDERFLAKHRIWQGARQREAVALDVGQGLRHGDPWCVEHEETGAICDLEGGHMTGDAGERGGAGAAAKPFLANRREETFGFRKKFFSRMVSKRTAQKASYLTS